MQGEADRHLNAQAVDIPLRHVALVPQGSIVVLSDGCSGMVAGAPQDVMLQPIVRVVADAAGHPLPHREIDLREDRLEVVRICDAWSPEVLLQVVRG